MSAPRPSKQDIVYAHVKAQIVSRILQPGDRVNGAETARDLGVSNIPVREALRRLEAERWLEHGTNSGMRVATQDRQTWVNVTTPFAVLSGYATAAAAETLRERGDIGELRALNAQMRDTARDGDFAAFTTINREFHQRMFDATPNPVLRRMVTEDWQRMHIARAAIYTAIPTRAVQSLQEHDLLLEMIANGAPGFEIEAAAREHTLRTVAAQPENR